MPIKPTIPNLREYGAKPLAAWLITEAKRHHLLTYTQAKERLISEVGFSKPFSTRLGEPAGRLMDRIQGHPKWKNAPLLNTILVQAKHDRLAGQQLPGSGVGSYLAIRYNKPRLDDMTARENEPQDFIKYSQRAMAEVYAFRHWDDVFADVFGGSINSVLEKAAVPKEQDFNRFSGGRGGGEGKEHKALRKWVQQNVSKLIRPKSSNLPPADTELELKSGDRVDVVQTMGNRVYVIEVKSRISNEVDLTRGVYQCVKYRAVMAAQRQMSEQRVHPLLIVERPKVGSTIQTQLKLNKIDCWYVAPNRRMIRKVTN